MPLKINNIANKFFLSVISSKKKYERSGTNTNPKDSKIGKSFIPTPFFNAIKLNITETKNTLYAITTCILNTSEIIDVCLLFALFFRSICEHEERNTPKTTNK